MGEPWSNGSVHSILTTVLSNIVTGASGVLGAYAAKIEATSEKALYPNAFLASTLNL
jgi:hypothetical protein